VGRGVSGSDLASWNYTATREAIVEFAESAPIAPEQRIAVFDSRIGQRPALAAGNSNGDAPMFRSPAVVGDALCAVWCSPTSPIANSIAPPARRTR
jgi:hypothetical protein